MAAYHAKKRLGQNFLKSDSIIQKIIEAVNPLPGESIIEVGPGRGALTTRLADSNAEITAVEFDRDLIGHLNKLFKDRDNITLVNMDFLKFEPEIKRFKLVGNLPYNITSPVIDWCVAHRERIHAACFMVQKEVALRLSSSPGSKDWSPIAIFTQLYFNIKVCFDVSPQHFQPPPKVTSSVIELRPRQAMEIEYLGEFEGLVRQSFRQRRKILLNNLVPDLIADATTARDLLEEAGLAANCRAEQISTEQFLKLTKLIVSRKLK